MAGAVVKYKPEKVDKMMRIAQASALDVSLFAIRASLPIGGLLWMFSNNLSFPSFWSPWHFLRNARS